MTPTGRYMQPSASFQKTTDAVHQVCTYTRRHESGDVLASNVAPARFTNCRRSGVVSGGTDGPPIGYPAPG